MCNSITTNTCQLFLFLSDLELRDFLFHDKILQPLSRIIWPILINVGQSAWKKILYKLWLREIAAYLHLFWSIRCIKWAVTMSQCYEIMMSKTNLFSSKFFCWNAACNMVLWSALIFLTGVRGLLIFIRIEGG